MHNYFVGYFAVYISPHKSQISFMLNGHHSPFNVAWISNPADF